MITTLRSTQRRHAAAAAIHLSYAATLSDRLARTADIADPDRSLPSFMGAVADVLGFGSAVLSLPVEPGGLETLVTSSPTGRIAYDLEQVLGEGPKHDVAICGELVVGSPSAIEHRWPNYGPRVTELRVRSVAAVALPGISGSLGTLVVLDAHDPSESADIDRLREVADALTDILLSAAEPTTPMPPPPLLTQADHRNLIHQAVGMTMLEAGCSAPDALALITARAFADNVTIDDITDRIRAGTLQLEP